MPTETPRFAPLKWGLLGFQAVGFILSALLIALTFASPKQVQHRLQVFAIAKVEEAATIAWQEAQAGLATADRAAKLGTLAERLGVQADQAEMKREEIVPALLGYALSDRCAGDCGLALAAGLTVNSALITRVAKMRVGQATLEQFIVERYDETLRGLITDLRRFGLVNAIALGLMMGLVLLHNYLNWRFVAFSVAVTAYATWATYGYVFGQNWALTILFQDWAGPGYQAGMIFASALFFDWLFLRGKITELVVNAIATALPG